MSEIAAEGAQPISAEIQENLLNPFIAAIQVSLAEMASTEVVVQGVSRGPGRHPSGHLCAQLRFTSGIEGSMALIFPKGTAEAFAKRMLADVSTEVDAQLIGDCVGEIGNVVAGQAKALFAATPYHFTFSLPKVADAEDFQPPPAPNSLVVAFSCDSGEFTLELFLKQ